MTLPKELRAIGMQSVNYHEQERRAFLAACDRINSMAALGAKRLVHDEWVMPTETEAKDLLAKYLEAFPRMKEYVK